MTTRWWALVELELAEAIELYPDRTQAETALAAVLKDEPTWCGLLRVEPISLELLPPLERRLN